MRGGWRYCLSVFTACGSQRRGVKHIKNGAKSRIEDHRQVIDSIRVSTRFNACPITELGRPGFQWLDAEFLFSFFFFGKSPSAQGEEVTQRLMRDLQRNSRPC